MICRECGKECRGEAEDCGIGSYEFWGATYYDSHEQVVCEHCGEQLDVEPWEVADDDGYGDYLYDLKKDREDDL